MNQKKIFTVAVAVVLCIGAVVGLLFWASKVKEAFDDRRLAWEREQVEDR